MEKKNNRPLDMNAVWTSVLRQEILCRRSKAGHKYFNAVLFFSRTRKLSKLYCFVTNCPASLANQYCPAWCVKQTQSMTWQQFSCIIQWFWLVSMYFDANGMLSMYSLISLGMRVRFYVMTGIWILKLDFVNDGSLTVNISLPRFWYSISLPLKRIVSFTLSPYSIHDHDIISSSQKVVLASSKKQAIQEAGKTKDCVYFDTCERLGIAEKMQNSIAIVTFEPVHAVILHCHWRYAMLRDILNTECLYTDKTLRILDLPLQLFTGQGFTRSRQSSKLPLGAISLGVEWLIRARFIGDPETSLLLI